MSKPRPRPFPTTLDRCREGDGDALADRVGDIIGRLMRRGGELPDRFGPVWLVFFQSPDPLRGDGVPGKWARYRADYVAEHGTWALPLPG